MLEFLEVEENPVKTAKVAENGRTDQSISEELTRAFFAISKIPDLIAKRTFRIKSNEITGPYEFSSMSTLPRTCWKI